MSPGRARPGRARLGTRAWASTFVAITLGASLGVIGVVFAAGSLPALIRAQALPAPGWTLSPTTPLESLSDGSRVTLNLKANEDVVVNQVQVRQCRLGIDYVADADTRSENGNCPPGAVSTSATHTIIRGSSITEVARTDQGAFLTFAVGTGVVGWEALSGPTSLSCDASHPCALVVKMFIGSDVVFKTFELHFATDDPIAACGAAAEGSLITAGSDEMRDAWAEWTRGFCAERAGGAPTRAAFTGEGEAVRSFTGESSEGASRPDLVYTGAGYSDTVDIVGEVDPAARRDAVAVPVALNAAVVAAGGGYFQLVNGEPIGDKAPFPAGSVALSAGEVAAFLSGGIFHVTHASNPYLSSISQRNPLFRTVVATTDALNFLVSSQVWAPSFFITNYARKLAPHEFIVPGSNPVQERLPTADIVRAEPDFSQLATYTGRPTLGRSANTAFFSANAGPIWALTDAATAAAIGMTPSKIENANGTFVEPTPASITAAVDKMSQDESGIRIPDPTATAAAGAVQPYPGAYVVYALVPREPLVDESTCTARTDSQALLNSWLAYVTGPGQQKLPAGMVPIPPALVSEAQQAIQEVGTASVTGPCEGRVVTAPPSAPAAPGSAVPPIGSAATPPPFGATPTPARVGTAVMPGGSGSTSEAATTKEDNPRLIIPAFAGRRLPEPFDGALALIAIVIVTSLAVYLTARHLASPGARGVGGTRGSVFLVVLWGAVAAAGVALVVYEVGPLTQQRDQDARLSSYRQELRQAAHASEAPTLVQEAQAALDDPPPDLGATVGVVEIGSLEVQAVAIEGVGPSETQKGPGHVPGTAGLGQPGNSVLVARRNSFGAPFKGLGTLSKDDKIVVTTTQGQSVYKVASVRNAELSDRLFAASDDDRLTLVTSGSKSPWNDESATVAVARMQGLPFEPTPQGARTASQSDLRDGASILPAIALTVLAYGAVVALSVLMYRRLNFRVAYVLSLAPIVALTVITGQVVSQALPAWM